MTDLAIEAVEALRSALDQAAFASAVAAGKPHAKSAYFPIGDDAAGLETGIKGRCKDVPAEIVSLFRSLNPYKGGNDVIWALNKLCNASKHKFVVPVGTAVGKISMGPTALIAGPNNSARMSVPKWDTEKNEMVMFIIGPESKVDYNFSLSFHIAFGEVDPVSGCEVFSALDAMIREVEQGSSRCPR